VKQKRACSVVDEDPVESAQHSTAQSKSKQRFTRSPNEWMERKERESDEESSRNAASQGIASSMGNEPMEFEAFFGWRYRCG
jgi:hypothetical protein